MSWKTLGVLGAIYTLAASGIAYGALTTKEEPSKLETTKENIVDSKEYVVNGKTEVYYSYKTDKVVSDEPSAEVEEVASKKGLRIMSELKERRGENYKVFATDKEQIVYEFVPAGVQYYKDPAGDWWEVDHATTTKADYDKETKTIGDQIIEAITPKASAQTFYPSSAEQVRRGDTVNETWATIRGGAGVFVDTGPSTTFFSPFINANASSNKYDLYQFPIFPFDTSSIADTDTVTSATFSLVVKTKYSGLGDLSMNLSGSDFTNGASDYNTTISTYATKYITDKAISTFTADNTTYNDMALNSSGLAAISLTGTTKFAMRFSIDIANSGTPTWSSSAQGGIEHVTVDAAGTTKDPKLVIVATPAATYSDSGPVDFF